MCMGTSSIISPKEGYSHFAVKHGAKEWGLYDYRTKAWHGTNGVENFWNIFKNSIRSTHIHVSPQHLPTYLAEFTFRANHRHQGNAMLDVILAAM